MSEKRTAAQNRPTGTARAQRGRAQNGSRNGSRSRGTKDSNAAAVKKAQESAPQKKGGK